MSAITTRNLTRLFGKLAAVDDLNLKIPSGSLYGLIGPNGAGKTTTLRMLAGLLEPTSGEIRINELSTRQYWREIQWQIGFMPDFFGVYDDLLVWEYLDFFARCYQLEPERRRQVTDELLELVDLTTKKDAYVQTLSRGMRQRLCLAHALVHDPQILLLDEPASGLDPRARIEMRELLRELRSMGKTILVSSHILSELAELCDAIAIMEKGKLIANGTLHDIRSRLNNNRTLNILTLKSQVQVEPILRNYPGVQEIQANHNHDDIDQLTVSFSGDEKSAADLLDALIYHGIRVVSFSEKITGLEEAFLQLTEGEVA